MADDLHGHHPVHDGLGVRLAQPAVSFALIGVIVGEFIGAEFGIGRLIIESEARGEAPG